MTCSHHVDEGLGCADCAVESGEYRWLASGELELIEIKTVQDLCDHPRHPRALLAYARHHELAGYCGCDSCEAYRRAR